MTDKKQPFVTRELVEFLERVFPDQAPSETDTSRQIWIKAGAVKVVRKLRSLYEQQNG